MSKNFVKIIFDGALELLITFYVERTDTIILKSRVES